MWLFKGGLILCGCLRKLSDFVWLFEGGLILLWLIECSYLKMGRFCVVVYQGWLILCGCLKVG